MADNEKSQKEEQEQIEKELTDQTHKRVEDLKKNLGDQLDKFGEEVVAFLKSTGQTKPKPKPTQDDHKQEVKK